MLVLARRAGEKLLIGDEIEVLVVRIDGNRVRLAVEAPKDVKIQRDEVVRDIETNGRRDSGSSATSEDAPDSESGRDSGR